MASEPKVRSRSQGVLWLVGLRFLILGLQMVNVKVAVDTLGWFAYGIAINIGIIRVLWQFVDLDIPQGMIQILSRTFRVETDRAWNYFRSGLFLHLIIGLVGMAGLFSMPMFLGGSKDWHDVPQLQLLFWVSGAQFFFDVYGSAFNAPFNAREQFHKVAALTSVIPVFAIALQIALVLILRSPLGVLLGTLADSVIQFVVKLAYIVRRERDFKIWPRFNLADFSEISLMGLKSYVAGLSTRIGGNADKVIVASYLGEAVLAIYSTACRIPQILLEAFGKITESITPEMAHLAHNEPHRLADIFRRNFRFVGFVAGVGIVFVGGFGDVILRAWMAKEIPGFGLLVFLMGIYYGLELHHSTITRVFFAQGKAHLMLPFTLWNSIVTLCATKYLAVRFGILGAASMNCFIDLAQILPIHYYCQRYGVREVSLVELLRITAGVIGVGAVAGLAALLIVGQLHYSRWGALGVVAFIPFLCLALAALYQRMGLMTLPDGLAKILGKNGILRRLFAVSVG